MKAHGGRRIAPAVVLAVAAALATIAPASAAALELDRWKTATAGPFRLLTNADGGEAAELLLELERFRRAFEQLAPGMDASFPVPTEIVAFRDAESYGPYKSQQDARGARIMGQFLSHRDGNFITLNADPRATRGLGIVLHEYVHHVLNQNLPRVPRWLNEGLAEYYSTFEVEGSFAVIGRPVERHLRWWRENDEAALVDVLAVERDAAHSWRGAGEFYAVSWGLAHYLLAAPARAPRLAAYLGDVAAGADPADSLLEHLEMSAGELEAELRRYLVAETLPAASLGVADLGVVEIAEASAPPDTTLTVLGELAARLGNERHAEGFFDRALAHRPDNAEALAGLAALREQQGRIDEARYLYTDALAAGPRSARTYLRHGRHLLRRAELERWESAERERELALRAKVSFAAAAALEPQFAESNVMLAATHLFADLDAGEGIGFGRRALASLPTRGDVAVTLARLHLKAGEIDRARRLTEGSVRLLASDDEYRETLAEVERAALLLGSRHAVSEGRWEEAIELFDQAISQTRDRDLRSRMEEQLERLREQSEAAAGRTFGARP